MIASSLEPILLIQSSDCYDHTRAVKIAAECLAVYITEI